ncbi:MAG: LysM peptidoglycan-binding domain-containing protein [Gemmatimonadales bacterium]
MKRWYFIGCGVLASACMHQPVGSRPEPIAARLAPPVDSAPAEFVLPPPPPMIADTAELHRLAVDSAQDVKDMEMLERLRESAPLPAVENDPNAETDLTALFDINVARYAEHERVKFYLDFFLGPARERMGVWLNRLPVYEPMIRNAFIGRSLPQDLVYLGLIESGYSNTAVSRSRAVGMWQFMRATAKDYGLRVDQWVDDRRDPLKATDAAARYLADLTKRFNGSYYLAAAAYNAGGGRVSRGLRKLGAGADENYFGEDAEGEEELAEDTNGDDRFFHLSDTRYLRRETRDYVPKLIAAAMIAKQPAKYGFTPEASDAYTVDSVLVTEPTSLDAVARASGVDAETITALNPHLLRKITPPGASNWWIRVPTGFGTRTDSVLATLTPDERLPGTVHKVRARETLATIARRYGLTTTELAGFNPSIDRKKTLKTGTELRIPGIAALRRYAASDAAAAASGVHVVRSGETLGGIARRYRMTLAQLRAMNELGSRNLIRVGQRLRVRGSAPVATPAAARTSTAKTTAVAKPAAKSATTTKAAGSATKRRVAATHQVRRGDTLSGLAQRYGVSVKALMSANGLHSARGLKAGTRIKIPG